MQALTFQLLGVVARDSSQLFAPELPLAERSHLAQGYSLSLEDILPRGV